jgi:hypothetical protein
MLASRPTSSLLHDAILNAKELVKGAETNLDPGEMQEEFTMLCRQDFTAELGGSPQTPQAHNSTSVTKLTGEKSIDNVPLFLLKL